MFSLRVPSALAAWWRTRRWTRWAVELVVAAWSLLLIAWLVLYWAILPHIEQWRPQIEERATRALGVPVRIGHIEVRSGGWVPALEMHEVVLLDAQQREALRLPRVAAAVSVRSLLTLQLRFEQLLIEGPELDVRRDAQGRFRVAGLEMGGGASDADSPEAATDWLFDQGEFVIRKGTLHWTDELRRAPPLTLSDVDLVVRNGLRRHALRIDATPPADWGDRFSLRGQLRSPLLESDGDWRHWSGTLYAELPRARVSDLRRHVDLPFELTEGEGAVRGWLDLDHGEPRQATVDVALRAVSLRLARNVEPMVFERVEGRLSIQRDGDKLSFSADQFGFVTGDGLLWPRSDLALTLRQRRDEPFLKLGPASPSTPASEAWSAPVIGGGFEAQRLDLALMAKVASRIPLPPALRKLLAEADPQGVVTGLQARWDGTLDELQRYQVKARLAGLSLDAKAMPEHDKPGRPGWRNADIELQATETGGHALLAIHDGALEFPGVFAESVVPLERFNAQIGWSVQPRDGNAPPAIEVKVRNAKFANADAQGELDATWRTGEGVGVARGGRFPGRMELTGKLTSAQAAKTARYLPLGVPDAPRAYVAHAVRGGTISNATFHVKGDLWDFPYAGVHEGEFHIAGKCEDVTLAYVPGASANVGNEAGREPAWPAFTKVSGDLVFDRASMEIRNARGNLWGVALTHVNGGIRNLGHRPVLALEGQGHGPLADMIRYVNSTPIGTWTHQALAQAKGSGMADLKLDLSLPLDKLADARVNGSVALRGNDVHLRPDTPVLSAAKARVDFSHKGFSIVGGSARVLGGEAAFSGGLQEDGSMRFAGQGVATAEGMRRASEMGWLSRVASSFSGQTPYRMTLNIVQGHPEFSVTSSLAGLASDLPAPLRKTSESTLPFRLQTSMLPPGERGVAQDQVRLEIGHVVQAQFVRDLSRDAALVLRGGIGVHEPAPQPARGVHANVTLPHINVNAWSALLGKALAPATTGGSGASSAASGGNSGAEGYVPTSVALRAQEMVVSSRTLTRVVAGLSSHEEAGRERIWRGNAEADQLNGYFEVRPSRGATPGGRVYARLARLAIPQGEAEGVESLLDQSPSSVPALDIVVDDFELLGKKLGRVEIEAVNRMAGDTREWRLSKFNVLSPEARLLGTGQWAGNARKRMTLDFKLELTDGGGYLERITGERVLRGGKGALQGQLSWLGSPMSLDYPSLSGQVNVALERGQFLKVEPGAARLLGVLNLQSLPRRLTLDFRDVFMEGFAFDAVNGDVKIEQGMASTNNLRMRGVQAAVLMEGKADIERETQDLRVVVVPEINAGTASLAYAAINPAVGLGTFLAQILLRKPLVAAGTREFRITGSWDDPKVERVERKPAPEPSIDRESPTLPSKPPTS